MAQAAIHLIKSGGIPHHSSQPGSADAERVAKMLRTAKLAGDLEGDVYDIVNMARLTVGAVEGAIGSDHSDITGRPDHYLISSPDRDATIFAVIKLLDMVEVFESRFQRALKGME